MSTFIALPKKSKLEIADSEIQSIEDKRQLSWRSLLKVGSLLAGALIPPIGTLIDLGFSQIELLQPTATSLELSAESTSNFIPLNSLGAYLVSSIDKQKIEDAQESFDKSDYVIVPDVQLSLSEPICSENVFWRGRQVHWPPESGIHEAHSRRVTGAGVLVGVLDTGCDADHIQLRRKRIDFRYVPHHSESENLHEVRGFDVNGHGTHVCGIISGNHVGVAPDADLMVAAVVQSETRKTSLARIVRGLDWMLAQISSDTNLSKPAIISMSLGFMTEDLNESETNSLMVDVRRVISSLVEDYNVLPVVAIGNEGRGNMRAPGYFPETLSVGAVDFNHEPAHFSGGGSSPIGGETQPNIAGYGVGIFSCLERDTNNRSAYTYMSGTSMATPYVAGIAALCASADTKLQGEVLRQHLLNTALPIQARKDRVGAGLARFT
jgi:hypothetical protein